DDYSRYQENEEEEEGVGDKVRRFFGMAPKGYTRSDERIYEEVCERLARDGHIDPSDIEVKVSEGEVILEGSVDDRRAKHHAEDIVDDVFGVKDVVNQLRVDRNRSSTSATTLGV